MAAKMGQELAYNSVARSVGYEGNYLDYYQAGMMADMMA